MTKKLSKWKKIELDILMKLRHEFNTIYYQYPIVIEDEETGRKFIHKIDFVVVRDDGERIPIEYDGEYHYRSLTQRNKTEWRNKGILKVFKKLVIVDGWKYQLNPEKGFEKLLKQIRSA